MLIRKEGTLFHHRPPPRPDDETLWEMQIQLQDLIHTAAFRQYEVSAYALTDRQCRHNLNYWQFGDYLGIGAGAHGKISDADSNVWRYWKTKHPTSYLNESQSAEFSGGRSRVQQTQLPFEFMMNALRLTQGFDTELFVSRTGQDIGEIQPLLAKHQDLGLLEFDDTQIKASAKGRQFLDSMLQDYLPE